MPLSPLLPMPLPTLRPRAGVQGAAAPVAEADPPAQQKAGCHSLSQSPIGRVQQKLLPAVGAHQPHRLLVQAHLPESTPPVTTGLAAAGRGSHSQTPGDGEEAPLGSPRGKAPEAWDPGPSWGGRDGEAPSSSAPVPSTMDRSGACSKRRRRRSLDSPTRSQARCMKRPLPPGMASLWPLREEMPMLTTHSGLSPSPCPS